MISTRSLTKDFVVSRTNTVHAVRGISLDIEPGELVAVLGPNGAGKSTTMRMLTTLIAPTSGSASVAGHDVVAQSAQVRRLIGYVGQGNGAGHNQRAGDELTSQGLIYGLDRRSAKRRAGELLEALDLAPLRNRKVSSLSGGQRRRLDVAMGLVHSPSLLFLDEPSTGLDPQNRANLWEHILQMRDAATHADDDHADHPLPRRGRLDGRPGGRRRPRRGHRGRHRGGTQGQPGRRSDRPDARPSGPADR